MRGFEGTSGDRKLDKAQDLIFQAWDEPNPAKRIKLALQALSISSDCADAYVILAEEEADTVGRALEYYRKGVAAGERTLGKEFFKENVGYFWGILEARPYMRARQGLAETLWGLGQTDEALAHFQEMLRLNPNDNQGIRYHLASLLLQLNQDIELAKLIKRYQGDPSASWLYTKALLAFRKDGPSAKANQALKVALNQNPHVPAYLISRKRIPNRMPDYIGLGDENEAIDYAAEHLNYWRRTPGAIEWLQSYQIPSKGKSSDKNKPAKKT